MVEGTLEVAVAKQLNLAPLEGSIVTSGLQFRAKAVLLQALLNRDPANKEALKVVKELLNFSDRNDLLHGIAMHHPDGIQVVRRSNNGVFRSVELAYPMPVLRDLILKVGAMAQGLQDALGISADDYRAFLRAAHNAQTKPSTSPSPPSSKRKRFSKSHTSAASRPAKS